MLYSILIAHYNNYDYFVECYESIQKQTHQDYEIILVDDCSTDDSLIKIKALVEGDPKVKIYKNEENKGVGFTKKRCVELATGEICGFVDPDDAIKENAIELILKPYQDPSIVAVYSQFVMCNQQLTPLKLFKPSRQVKNNNKLFFNIFLEVNHLFSFRKSAYLKTSGINENLTSAVDQDLYLKLYDVGKVKFIKHPLYLYRLHDKGVSQEKSKKGKLNQNWHTVIHDTLKRRGIEKLYGTSINNIDDLPTFVFNKQNTIFRKIKNRLS